ncbi:hypothetical protein MKX01_037310, partial [Papaver californicum]
MGSPKSPGPDGYPTIFYKKCWNVVGDEVVQLIQDCFRHSCIHPRLNNTYLVLIPEKKNASTA